MENIYEISFVEDILLLKTNPPSYFITVHGEVNSGGWSNPLLLPRIYIDPPDDGILDIDFAADAPSGRAIWVMTSIKATALIEHSDWLKGFRFISGTNAIEVLLDATKEDANFEALERFPWFLDVGSASSDREDSDLSFASTTISQPADEFGILDVADLDQNCTEKVFASYTKPETKTEWVNKCQVKIAGKCRLSTKLPEVYYRESKEKLFLRVCWSSAEDIRNAVEDCLSSSAIAGILAGALTGNVQAAAAAAKTTLLACLKAKGVEALSSFDVSIGKRTEHGKWKRKL